jgi:hypothetical protein
VCVCVCVCVCARDPTWVVPCHSLPTNPGASAWYSAYASNSRSQSELRLDPFVKCMIGVLLQTPEPESGGKLCSGQKDER